eukprot:PhM_4_TR332/c0_g2_i1/m.61121/K01460/gsp; glutathionylspermidine amidase/synthetase
MTQISIRKNQRHHNSSSSSTSVDTLSMSALSDDPEIIHHNSFCIPFGVAVGSYKGVVAYSNGKDSFFSNKKMFVNVPGAKPIFTGYKWQCVEYARRWLILQESITIPSIPCAYDIWNLTTFNNVVSGAKVPIMRCPNKVSKVAPSEGDVLIWDKTFMSPFGHVAIISGVDLKRRIVQVAEENRAIERWMAPDLSYSRELALVGDAKVGYAIIDGREKPLGWMRVASKQAKASAVATTTTTAPAANEENVVVDAAATAGTMTRVKLPHAELPISEWVTEEDTRTTPELAIFAPDYVGSSLAKRGDKAAYYSMPEAVAQRIHDQANELHTMSMAAIDLAVRHDDILRAFSVPPALVDSMRQSWLGGDEAFLGRFDFGFDGKNVKMFEYNADSCGVLCEFGMLQDHWARRHGVDFGRSAGSEILPALTEKWRRLNLKTRVHFMIDTPSEELYTALFMKRAANAAGVDVRIVIGVDELEWGNADRSAVVDGDGVEVTTVWKLWAWDTVFRRFESESKVVPSKPRLQDVLLHRAIRVFEPMWKYLTQNKAILAVLWRLYPNHPCLLKCDFELSDEMRRGRYVRKPTVGRTGSGVTLMSGSRVLEAADAGRFADELPVYQEMFDLPSYDGFHAVIGAFVVGGATAGFGIREDRLKITEVNTPFASVRIVV